LLYGVGEREECGSDLLLSVWTDLAMGFLGKEEVEVGSRLVRGLTGGTDEGEVATDAEH
jgi:hypothetical protein